MLEWLGGLHLRMMSSQGGVGQSTQGSGMIRSYNNTRGGWSCPHILSEALIFIFYSEFVMTNRTCLADGWSSVDFGSCTLRKGTEPFILAWLMLLPSVTEETITAEVWAWYSPSLFSTYKQSMYVSFDGLSYISLWHCHIQWSCFSYDLCWTCKLCTV